MARSSTNGFQMVTISPNVPGSMPNGMNGDFSRMTILSSTDSQVQPPADTDPRTFVKAKRKRLSKACENCHKSKRRCDGTAPCSNCYFASKPCVYLDKDGKQVPAPRSIQQEASPPNGDHMQPPIQMRNPATSPVQTNGQIYAVHSGQRRQAEMQDASVKRARGEGLSPASSSSAAGSSPRSDDIEEYSPAPDMDSTIILELVNLFFTHCNPHRLIFHKPSFSAGLSQDQVPQYLLLAICALAAPWSPEMREKAKEKMPRLAGVPFFMEARRLMFDGAGHLLSPPTLATAQALCLLEMHEVAASHSWTQHYRYFDLAMQFLEGTLQITQPDGALSGDITQENMRNYTVERECVRRCFWLVQTMFWINGIYTYRPMRPRSLDLMRQVRLPVDEASFELAKITTQPEYLHTAAPRTKYASQFGHVCRILSLYQVLQAVIAKDDSSRAGALASCRESVETWLGSLPEHLRFSEESLNKQIAMHETSSNTGAWCFCFIHTLHPCYLLDLYEAQGILQVQPLDWIRDQLKVILRATGNRAKNSILSACTLWTYSKYFPSDPDVEEWDRQFESLWGYRVAVVAHHWRETQQKQRDQIGRAYPVEGVPQRETAPMFTVAETDSPPASSPTASSSSHSHSPSRYSRGSPRDRPLGAPLSRGAGSGSSAHMGPAHRAAHDGAPQGHGRPSREQGQGQGRHARNNSSPGGAPLPGAAATPSMPPRVVPTARTLHGQQSLPSLKASGLLDSWRPPMEAFAYGMALARAEGGPVGGMGQSPLLGRTISGNAPAGLDWLSEEQER